MGILYIVATPIGNLKDITLRALEVLRAADLILAEDTRVTKKLLTHYNIHKSLKRYDENVAERMHPEIKRMLQAGMTVAVVSDAGTPAISDPGSRLVAFIKKELPHTEIIPVPGPSALTAALSACGLNADQFTFLGYPPHKKGRQTFFAGFKSITPKPVVLYESPHRLAKTFGSLVENFGPEKEIVVAKELTKIHEEIWQGSVENAQKHFQGQRSKGEFVVIIP